MLNSEFCFSLGTFSTFLDGPQTCMSFACLVAFATHPSGVLNSFPDSTLVGMNSSITHPQLDVAPKSATV